MLRAHWRGGVCFYYMLCDDVIQIKSKAKSEKKKVLFKGRQNCVLASSRVVKE